MRQYHGIKQQVPNALLLFRLGDFYELFYEDAITAARELEITLTARNKEKGQPIPMCGVPYHAAENYISRLIQKGYRVAICDQMEDASLAKKLVKREVTRIVTPGTAMNGSVLRSHENHYLAAVMIDGTRAGLGHVDVSTGEFRATELDLTEVAAAIDTLNAKEFLAPTGSPLKLPCLKTDVEPWVFGLVLHVGHQPAAIASISSRSVGTGLRELDPLAVGAAAAGNSPRACCRDAQRTALDHLERPAFYARADALMLDATTVRNLELVEPLFAGESKESTLLHVLDRTRTGMGGRMLRRRLLAPCLAIAEIEARLDAVEELHSAAILRAELGKDLASILDLERLLSKVSLSTASPRDLAALARSLGVIPSLKQHLVATHAARFQDLRDRLDELAEVRDPVLTALSDELPANLNDGGIIRDDYLTSALDRSRDLQPQQPHLLSPGVKCVSALAQGFNRSEVSL